MLASRVRVHAFTAPRAICHISNSNIWVHIYGWNYSSDQPKKEFGENRNFFRCSSCARQQNLGSPRHRPSRGGIRYIPRKFTSIALQYSTSKPPGRGPKTRGGGAQNRKSKIVGLNLEILNSLVKHQSSTQAKKQQQNSLVPEAKCQSDVYQAGRLKLGVGTVPFKNAGSAPALAA